MSRLIVSCTTLLLIFLSHQARSEYRVFVLQISKRTAAGDPGLAGRKPAAEDPSPEGRTIISTLDPQQYIGYYPIEKDEAIKYTATWRCPGRTDGFKPLCPNPRAEKVNP